MNGINEWNASNDVIMLVDKQVFTLLTKNYFNILHIHIKHTHKHADKTVNKSKQHQISREENNNKKENNKNYHTIHIKSNILSNTYYNNKCTI